MTRRVRYWLLAVAVLVALLLGAGLFVRSLLSPERFTAILQQAASDVGLVLKLDGAAEAVLFPSPAVEIHGARLHLPDEPLLMRADRLRLVLPWRSLLGAAPAITRLEIEAPWVDLAQVRAWMAQLPPSQGDGPPTVPAIDAGMRIRDGRFVSGDELMLAGVALDTGSLRMGQPFTLDVAAASADAVPLQLHLSTVPLQNKNRLRLQNLTVTASSGDSSIGDSGSGDSRHLTLSGDMEWYGGSRVQGELTGQLTLAETNYALGLALAPQASGDLHWLNVRVDSDTTHMALRMSPKQVAEWWQRIRDNDSAHLPLPPIAGTAAVQQLNVGALHIQGLQVQSSLPASPSSSVPAATGSTPTPAAARSSNAPAVAATVAKEPA